MPTDDHDPCPHCGQPVGDAWLVCAWCGGQLAAPAELLAGAPLSDGRYQVLHTIGRGGFGITYEAGDARLKRRVAIKELFPDSAVRHGSHVLSPPHARPAFRAARERFLREARVLARFTHPGIVRVYEVFEEHSTAYLVMELLSGQTLVDILRARDAPFLEDEVLDVAGRVAAALRPVHAAGVLHRDLNPSNVMLTHHGRVVLIDFGLARDFDQDQTMGMTRVVTPGYAPLEQYRGQGRFGPSTDVYGLAATCYRLATSRVPVAAIARDAGAELVSPHRLNPAISKAVSDAILDGLELEPEHRPQDLDAFLARLGVHRLPEAHRSILAGSAGTEGDQVPADGGMVDGFDPGPAVATAPPSDAGPRVQVAPVSGADPDPDPVTLEADLTRPGSGPEEVDAMEDVTFVPGRLPATAALIGEPPALRPQGPRRIEALEGSPAERVAPLGAGRPGRRKVTIPLVAAALAVAAAAPVVALAIVVVLVLPLLATVGDGVARRLRADAGVEARWAEVHLPKPVLAPVRFVRNVVISVLRTSPVVGVGAILLALWYVVAETSLSVAIVDGLLRIIGAGTVGALLMTSWEGSPRFPSGLGLDEVVRRSVPGGRTTERLVIGWIVVALVVVLALWLDPDPFPLP